MGIDGLDGFFEMRGGMWACLECFVFGSERV
jgi:hypothetical protein